MAGDVATVLCLKTHRAKRAPTLARGTLATALAVDVALARGSAP